MCLQTMILFGKSIPAEDKTGVTDKTDPGGDVGAQPAV